MNFISSILSLFNGDYKTIKKADVYEAYEKTLSNIEVNVIPSIAAVNDAKDLSDIRNNTLWHSLANACDISPKDAKTVLARLDGTFANFLKTSHVVLNLIEKGMTPVSTDRAIKAKDAAIIRIVSDIGAMAAYVLDILTVITTGKNDNILSPVRVKEIMSAVESFGELFKAYGNVVGFQNLLNEIVKMDTVTLNLANSDESTVSYAVGDMKMPPLPIARNFIGNPFYHLGMWWEDMKLNRAKVFDLRKQLITLRILEMKQKQEKNPTEEIAKQIEVYENELAEIEYKIAKLRS